MKLGMVVGYCEIGLKQVAENCVEMRKLDRKRALRTSGRDCDEWRAFAIDALSTALVTMQNAVYVTAVDLPIEGAVKHEALVAIEARYVPIKSWMLIELDDQNVETQLELRDKLVGWGKNGGFALGGYLIHEFGPKAMALLSGVLGHRQ